MGDDDHKASVSVSASVRAGVHSDVRASDRLAQCVQHLHREQVSHVVPVSERLLGELDPRQRNLLPYQQAGFASEVSEQLAEGTIILDR